MPDTKGSELNELSIVTDDDLFVTINNPSVDPSTRKLKFENLKKSLYKVTSFADTDYSVNPADIIVNQTATMTAPRAVTLPSAASVPAGYAIIIQDNSGTVNSVQTVTINRSGTDTINGSVDPRILSTPYGVVKFTSDGATNWIFSTPGLKPDNNLSDLLDNAAARNNLGLGNSAVLDVGNTSLTVAAGDDPRIINSLQNTNNLSDVNDVTVSRTNLGLGDSAVLNVGTASSTVAAGDDSRIVNALQTGNNLSDLTDAAAARVHLHIDNLATLLSNLNATTDPGINNDTTEGYAIGSLWINVQDDKVFRCVDNTDGAAIWRRLDLNYDSLHVLIDGGGSAITTGIKQYLEVPFACTVKAVTLLADQSGDIVIDIWKDTYANYPPTDADSITDTTPPTISASNKSQDTALTNWTSELNEGDILAFNVDSVTTIQKVTVILKVEKI